MTRRLMTRIKIVICQFLDTPHRIETVSLIRFPLYNTIFSLSLCLIRFWYPYFCLLFCQSLFLFSSISLSFMSTLLVTKSDVCLWTARTFTVPCCHWFFEQCIFVFLLVLSSFTDAEFTCGRQFSSCTFTLIFIISKCLSSICVCMAMLPLLLKYRDFFFLARALYLHMEFTVLLSRWSNPRSPIFMSWSRCM